MAEVKIVDARDTVKLTPTGALESMSRYEYTIGELGPFVYEVPSKEDTPEKFKAEIERRKKLLEAIK